MAEAFVSQGLNVTMLEALDWVLPTLLDFDVAAYVEKHLRNRGVKLLFSQRVTGFEGDARGKVRKVITRDMELETGLVLLAIGTRPNVSLAQEAGLTIGCTRGISISQHLQTSDPDIYAGGDCVENVNLITQEKILAPLGSTANKHGRVIGTNITGGRETFPGVLGTSIVKVFDDNVARVGLNELQAREAGYDTATALVPSYEHATYYPKGQEILVKLVAEKSSGRLLGGQVVGPGDTAKRIDVLATALTSGATVDDLADLDLAYAPPYNSALDPLHNAANVIRNKQAGYARALTPMEVKNKLDNGDDFVLLDVRSPGEWDTSRLEARQARLLPLRELRKRLGELSKDEETVIFCQTSVRAYQAQRILDGAGFRNVKFMDGSIAAWPYDAYLYMAHPDK
jgi:rhodanese-related sulfurtransferase